MMKKTALVLCIAMLLFMEFLSASAIAVTVDCGTDSSLPDATVKRGWVMPFDRNTQETRDRIRACAGLGMEIINGHRKMNLDNTGESEDYVGSDGLEIYRRGDEYKWRADADYVELLKVSRDNGLTVFAQVSGTSPAFDIDPEFFRLPFETRRDEGHSKQGEFGKEFELPVKDQWGDHAKVVSDWMRGVDREVASRAKRKGEIVWIGSEEVAHTLGAREGEHLTPKAKAESIRRYVEFWTPLAMNLRRMGIRSGGIQNNASNRGSLYDLTGEEMVRLQTPVDFITIQNYQGENNAPILNQLRVILKRMKASRPELYADTKIVFDRYGWKKRNSGVARYEGAEGIVHGLKAELVALNNSDILYGYCHMNARLESLTSRMFAFLNSMPTERRDIVNLDPGLDAFSCASNSEFSLAIWNTGTYQDITIKLDNSPGYDGLTLQVRKGSGAGLAVVPANWDSGSQEISGFALDVNEFAFINLSR
ncbi:MAG: hypothetical protein KAT00_13165 [Planctomycetes bacterium]|nr:hypothetical protein [Planctomycetota bacterium]